MRKVTSLVANSLDNYFARKDEAVTGYCGPTSVAVMTDY